ncbi:hypothetical protein WJX81_007068 [Elliptochloris bilobata]|uniref:Uncharacterized protein n=1 Tax=Elliptochloris bilobata TaxID=381761 RepID=A0AAW1RL05_9CHLO
MQAFASHGWCCDFKQSARQAMGALVNSDKQELACDGQRKMGKAQSKRPWPFGSGECRWRVFAQPTSLDELLDLGGKHDPMVLAVTRVLTSAETEALRAKLEAGGARVDWDALPLGRARVAHVLQRHPEMRDPLHKLECDLCKKNSTGWRDEVLLRCDDAAAAGQEFDVYGAVKVARREAAARARFGAGDAGPPARPKPAAIAPAPPTAAASGTGPGDGTCVGSADQTASWLEAARNKRGPSVPAEDLLNIGLDEFDLRFASAWRVLTSAERDLVKGFVLDGTRIGPGDLPAARAALLAVLDGNSWVGTEFKKAQTKRRDEALRACDESWAVIMAGDGSAEDKEVPSSKEGTGGAGASGSSLRSSDPGGLSDGLSGPGALLLRSGSVAEPMPWETPLCMGPGDSRGGACAPEVHAGDEAPGAVTDGADAEAPASPRVSAICERVDNLSGLFSLEHVVLLHSHGAPAALAVPGNEVSLPGAALAGQLRLLVADAFADEVEMLPAGAGVALLSSDARAIEGQADLNPDPSPGVLLVVAASAEGNAATAAAEELPALEVGANLIPIPSRGALAFEAALAEGAAAAAAAEELPALEVVADLSPMPDPGALPFEAALVEGAAVAAAPEELPAFEVGADLSPNPNPGVLTFEPALAENAAATEASAPEPEAEEPYVDPAALAPLPDLQLNQVAPQQGEGAAEEPAPAAAVGNPNPAAPAPLPDPEPVQAVPVEGEAAAVALAPVAGEAAGEALAPVAGEAAGEALAPVADEAAGEVPIPAPAVVAEIPAEQPRRIVRCGRALGALAVLAAVGQHYAPAPVKPVARAVYTGFLVTGIAGTEGKLLGQAALGAAAAAVGGTRHARLDLPEGHTAGPLFVWLGGEGLGGTVLRMGVSLRAQGWTVAADLGWGAADERLSKAWEGAP